MAFNDDGFKNLIDNTLGKSACVEWIMAREKYDSKFITSKSCHGIGLTAAG
jgi:hypothetical protein